MHIILFLLYFISTSTAEAPKVRMSFVQKQLKQVYGRSIAVVIGNDSYQNHPILSGAIRDARIVSNTFKTELGFDKVFLHTNADIQKLEGIVNALKRELEPSDKLVFYFAGHGVKEGSHGYLLGIDAPKERAYRYGLEIHSLKNMLSGTQVKQFMLVMDSCHSGVITHSTRSIEKNMPEHWKRAAKKKRHIVVSAVGANEKAIDNYTGPNGTSKPHGLFTYWLLEGLRGKANTGDDSFISDVELFEYIKKQVAVVQALPAYQSNPQEPRKEVAGTGRMLFHDPHAAAKVVSAAGGDLKEQLQAGLEKAEETLRDQAEQEWQQLEEKIAKIDAKAVSKAYSYAQKYNHREVKYYGVSRTAKKLLPAAFAAWLDRHQLRKEGEGYLALKVMAGSFKMGCDNAMNKICKEDEKPVHKSYIPYSFFMMKSEVTQGLYQKIMGTNPSRFKKCGSSCPVESVSWHDGIRFANALSEKEGLEKCYEIKEKEVKWPKGLDCQGWRYPTEAEWEYAARGGQDFRYAGSNKVDAVAWYRGNSKGRTHAVCGKQVNGYGFCDMSGNIYEWVWDWKGKYQSEGSLSATGPASGLGRVNRGGGWDGDVSCVRLTRRLNFSPGSNNDLGLRLIRTVK